MSLITIKHESALRMTASVRNHTWTIDALPNEGGSDAGPTPVELMTTALGACMAMHVAKYCQTAKLPHEAFSIDLAFELAKDPLRIGAVTADINLPSSIPEGRKEAIKRAALGCIIRNTLKESTAVDVEVVG